jgi:D-arabinose 1-dehydrogenase-like Zn-dependent alcohol dehydrogenase
VIALSSSAEKIEKARALGAHYLINYREVENWEDEVMKIVRIPFAPHMRVMLTCSVRVDEWARR